MQQIDQNQKTKNARMREEIQRFQAYGETLIQGFNKSHQADLESSEEKLKRAAKAQMKMYMETIQSISKDLETIHNKRAKDVEADWRQEQQNFFAHMEALMTEGEG